MNMQKGFTLIELVVVIVILGILAAVAIPRFVDLSDEARQAAIEGVAGAISSGMAINFAACSVSTTNPDCVATVDACDSADATAVLQDATALGAYTISGTAPTAYGESATCTLTLTADNTVTANYTVIQTAP